MSLETLGTIISLGPETSTPQTPETTGRRSGKWTDQDYVEFLLETLTNCDNARTGLKRGWDLAWQMYNNQFDFSEKADWQSQNYLPKFKMAVRSIKYILHTAFVRSGRAHSVSGLNDDAKEYQKDLEDGIQNVFDQIDFPSQLARSVFLGLLENLMIFKCYVDPIREEDPRVDPEQRYRFPCEPVSVYDFWIDNKNRGRFVIHRTKMDLADYREYVKKKIYLPGSLNGILEDFESKEEEYEKKLREGQTDVGKPPWRKEVELLEFWGDVDDERGNRIHQNVTFTVVNRKYLARRPIANPFRHGKPPFVWGPIIEKFPSVYHEGFGDGVIAIAKMMNESLNLILDANLAASVKAFEVNLDMLANPGELKSGIYPNKTIRVRGGAPGQQGVRDFSLGTINEQSLSVLRLLGGEFDNGTGSNEFISTASQSLGADTATEAKLKSSSAMSFVQAVGGEIEKNVLSHVAWMTAQNIFQYNPEIFGSRVLGLPASQARFSFKVSGISKVLAQVEEMNKMMMWLKFFMGTPVNKQINWMGIAKETAQLLGQDANRLLLTEAAQSPEPGTSPTTTEDAASQAANIIALQNQANQR